MSPSDTPFMQLEVKKGMEKTGVGDVWFNICF